MPIRLDYGEVTAARPRGVRSRRADDHQASLETESPSDKSNGRPPPCTGLSAEAPKVSPVVLDMQPVHLSDAAGTLRTCHSNYRRSASGY